MWIHDGPAAQPCPAGPCRLGLPHAVRAAESVLRAGPFADAAHGVSPPVSPPAGESPR